MVAPMGMSLFFCLSGFLIVSIIHRDPDAYSFLIKRMFRIVPAVLVYILLLIILFRIPTEMVVANVFFISNYWHVGLSKVIAPTSHLWSLCVEIHFYFVMTVLAFFFGRKAVWFVPPAALVVTGLRIEAEAYTHIYTHLRVDEILSGGILALVTIHKGPRLRAFLIPRWRPIALLVILTPLWMLGAHDFGGWLNYLRPYLTAAIVGVLIHCHLGWIHDWLEGKIAAYIAKISYALYIYHPLMIFGWMNAGSDYLRYFVKRPISYVLTLIAAHISTVYWEAYWQRLARRILEKRSA